MAKLAVSKLERLKTIKHQGVPVLMADFKDSNREEAQELLRDLITRLNEEPEQSVRLFLDIHNTIHDSSHSNEWKRHLDLFNSRLKKSAIVGLTPLSRAAMAGMQMYARLMGQD